jgi:penicillin-binding protein 1C
MNQGTHDPMPSLAPECRGLTTNTPPKIVSPEPHQVRLLVPGLDPTDQEVALVADAGGTELAWFVDGHYLGRAGADETVWWTPSPGQHTVVVQSDGGDVDRVSFEVRAAL